MDIAQMLTDSLRDYVPQPSLFDITDLLPWDFEPDIAEHLAEQLEPVAQVGIEYDIAA